MKSFKSFALVAALVLTSTVAFAGSTPIGVVTSIGSIAVNDAVTTGSTDLADGARLQTSSTPSEIHLATGADVRLATRSAGTFYSDHVSLDEGAVRVGSFNGLTVNARQLQISSDEPGTAAVIRINKKTVEVASVGGAVSVMDSGFLTRVASGTKMSFQQTGATPAGDQSSTNTGAAPAPQKSKMPSDEKTFLWVIGVTAVAALVIGLTAAAQGKSPF